jgi:hypothetical protein
MKTGALPDLPRELVDALYDTALDPGSWDGALAGISRWVGAAGTFIQVRHLTHGGEGQIRTHGCISERVTHYQAELWHTEPHLVHLASLPVFEPLLSREVVEAKSVRRTAYYGEFCEPQDFHDLQGLVMLRNSEWAVTLANHSARGKEFGADSCARLAAVGKHALRALRLAFDFAPQPAFVEQGAAGALRVASLCVDGGLRVLDAPDHATCALLAWPSCPLAVRSGVLCALQPEDQRALAHLLPVALSGGTCGERLGPDAAFQVVAVPGPRMGPFERKPCVRIALLY